MAATDPLPADPDKVAASARRWRCARAARLEAEAKANTREEADDVKAA